MGDIVSLKLHRKRKARAGKDAEAEANRAKFGRGKDERALSDALRAKDETHLDGHKREE